MIEHLSDQKVIAVVRGFDTSTCLEIAGQLRRAGVRLIEITMDSPDAVNSIEKLTEEFEDVIPGAGTVLSEKEVRQVKQGGAQFVLSPVLDETVLTTCLDQQLTVIPGCLTPSEMMRAHQLGADAIKLFPASSMGPDYLSSIRGPLPEMTYVPTGGVNDRNAGAFIDAGASAVGVGSFLTGQVEQEGVESVYERATQLLEAL
jgi:2-dehydro-3-deoxyphosphogluconate aldolase/(4S)-4-hydroxy-2-oxoglutarate aldolase